eukprot:GFUD01015093.1.p1 GENE.GFUD01015093.1~~GFUD01015093.1.p1  ORF type:complete len:199 (+),score=55.50 GFUD01015093.1:57-653(+)
MGQGLTKEKFTKKQQELLAEFFSFIEKKYGSKSKKTTMRTGQKTTMRTGQKTTMRTALSSERTREKSWSLIPQVDQTELLGMIAKLGAEVSEEELEEAIVEFEHDRDDTIDFEEILSLMKDVVSDVNDDQILREAFSMFDVDGNGFIDVKELWLIMQKKGRNLNLDQIKELIASADLNEEENISFPEFKKLMISPVLL